MVEAVAAPAHFPLRKAGQVKHFLEMGPERGTMLLPTDEG